MAHLRRPARQDRSARRWCRPGFDHAALDGLDEDPRTIGGRVYRFVATRYDVPVIVAAEDRPGDERSAAGVWALSRNFYPAERKRPLRNATVFISYDGRSYSDSPRAIYEELVRRGHDGEHVWIVRDGAFVPPGSRELGLGDGIVPTVVREGSREHYEALARARYVISNGFLPSGSCPRGPVRRADLVRHAAEAHRPRRPGT